MPPPSTADWVGTRTEWSGRLSTCRDQTATRALPELCGDAIECSARDPSTPPGSIHPRAAPSEARPPTPALPETRCFALHPVCLSSQRPVCPSPSLLYLSSARDPSWSIHPWAATSEPLLLSSPSRSNSIAPPTQRVERGPALQRVGLFGVGLCWAGRGAWTLGTVVTCLLASCALWRSLVGGFVCISRLVCARWSWLN